MTTTTPEPEQLAAGVETGTGTEGLDLARRGVAECLGTALLLAGIVGSGIMAQQLVRGDVGVQLLANTVGTAGALVGLILVFGAVSGAHFNPVVSIVDRLFGTMSTTATLVYIAAQVVGACAGTVLANLMFSLPAIEFSTTSRSGTGLWIGEVVATIGLLLVIHGCVRSGRSDVVPFAVAAWVASAMWFTSSTSFANPAVTIGRMLTNTFCGIAPASVPGFVLAQLVGMGAAYGLIRLFWPTSPQESTE